VHGLHAAARKDQRLRVDRDVQGGEECRDGYSVAVSGPDDGHWEGVVGDESRLRRLDLDLLALLADHRDRLADLDLAGGDRDLRTYSDRTRSGSNPASDRDLDAPLHASV